MAFEAKDMTGSVFANDRKETDKHPDRTGSALIDGVDYWVSGWLKKTKDGKPFLSLAFKKKDAAASRREPDNRRQEHLDDDPNDLPF